MILSVRVSCNPVFFFNVTVYLDILSAYYAYQYVYSVVFQNIQICISETVKVVESVI